MDQPSALRASLSIVWSLLTVRRPESQGNDHLDHSGLTPVLRVLAERGLSGVAQDLGALDGYLADLATVDPNQLSRSEGLAFWINLYNGNAIRLAAEAFRRGLTSVLRIPGAFNSRQIGVAGEKLSLDAIEHAKIRRFKDPRIHSALICGSLSCPTVRHEPYWGRDLGGQLEDQMRRFLRAGGALASEGGGVALSRIFLWYGSDFVRPGRMPTLLPSSPASILHALRPWLPVDLVDDGPVQFQRYDWGLGCAVL